MIAEAEPATGVGALALRLASALFLTAGCLFALLAYGITCLDTQTVGGTVRYVLPGASGRSLDPAVVRILTGCAFATGLLGAAVWFFERRRPIAVLPFSRGGRRPLIVLVAGLLLLVAALIVRFGV